jgi:glycosyltransferase involved in cell wall biosynthesis
MSLRIAMVGACPYPVPQGSQVFMRDHALALQACGHAVHLVVYGYGASDEESALPVHRAWSPAGIGRTQAGPHAAKLLLDLALVGRLRRVVREESIDVIFAHNYEALLAGLVAGVKPLIYHAHNVLEDELPYYFRHKGLPRRIGRFLDRALPRRACRVCTPHTRLAGHLVLSGCDPKKMAVIPPPVGIAAFETAPKTSDVAPVIYAGNLDSYQNLDLLQAAMARVREQLPEAVLQVGTAALETVPSAEMRSIPDFVSLRDFLKQDAVFAAPRISWSGYPVKLLNAMAAGLPVVACEGAAPPIRHEHNGLLTPPDDAEAFAAALLRLMQDHRLRTQLGKNAQKTIEEDHNPEKTGQQLEDIAFNALGRKSAGN